MKLLQRLVLALLIVGGGAFTPIASAQQPLLVTDGEPTGGYGLAVTLDGNHAAVGDPEADLLGGRVYIFAQQADGTWAQEGDLPSPLGAGTLPFGGVRFGATVALSGDRLAVAAPSDGLGSVWLYRRDPGTGTWAPEDTLMAEAGGSFGVALALSGDTLAVGNLHYPTPRGGWGRVGVYVREPEGWALAQQLDHPARTAFGLFGIALAFDPVSGRLVVGAPGGEGEEPSSAWAYVANAEPGGDVFVLDGPLVNPGAEPGRDRFGSAVAVRGDRALVGAPRWSLSGIRSGAVLAYAHGEEGWTLADTLAPAGHAPDEYRGSVLAMGTELAAVAALVDETDTIELYRATTSGWAATGLLDTVGDLLDVGVFEADGDALIVGTRGSAVIYPTALRPTSNETAPSALAFRARLAPNPFRGDLRVALSLAAPSHVRVEAFDVLGRVLGAVGPVVLAPGDNALILPLSGHRGVVLCRVTTSAGTVTLRGVSL